MAAVEQNVVAEKPLRPGNCNGILLYYCELYEREQASMGQIPWSATRDDALRPLLDASGKSGAVPSVAALSSFDFICCHKLRTGIAATHLGAAFRRAHSSTSF